MARHWVQSRTAPRPGPTRRHQWETAVCQRAQTRKIESGRKMEGCRNEGIKMPVEFRLLAEMRGRQSCSECLTDPLAPLRRCPIYKDASPTHRPRTLNVQVLFMPCVFACAHFFIFLFFLCLLRMRFLAHLSLILVSNDN